MCRGSFVSSCPHRRAQDGISSSWGAEDLARHMRLTINSDGIMSKHSRLQCTQLITALSSKWEVSYFPSRMLWHWRLPINPWPLAITLSRATVPAIVPFLGRSIWLLYGNHIVTAAQLSLRAERRKDAVSVPPLWKSESASEVLAVAKNHWLRLPRRKSMVPRTAGTARPGAIPIDQAEWSKLRGYVYSGPGTES
ncbi:hypothetical protein GQ53DRAFT_326721 [Thozetella sp. PMI_491]|nr:hypothetical protein GQ53DRAFT_326721 [Thozetella sp. PMI_491]